jgi:hypothetical protein
VNPRAAAALLLAVLCVCPGCGTVALIHDSILGPVSPAGRIHDTAVGSGFHVTATGPVADARGEPRLRAYPPDMIQRLGSPSSLYAAIQGLQAIIVGFTPLLRREMEQGRLPEAEAVAGLAPGEPLRDVLRELGPPETWIRQRSSSLMYYRSAASRSTAFYLGIPPLVAALLPVPGISSLNFRYGSSVERADKLLLLFDADDRLVAVVAGAEPGAPEGSAP